MYENDGTEVTDPVFPFSLRFEPTGEVGFPDDYDGVYFTDQLESIVNHTHLWKLYGLDAPVELGGVEHYIGDLVMTTQMTKSTFGDKDLFFRHQRLEEDLALMPEWQPYEPEFYLLSAAGDLLPSKCPFAHLW